MTIRLHALAACAALMLPAGAAAQPVAPAVDHSTEILKSTFGVFEDNGPAGATFTPTLTVSRAAKSNYGWVLLLRTDRPTVHWREEFTLPAPAETWGVPDGGQTHASKDRRSAITESDEAPHDGLIMHLWTVAPGDPAGHYVIRVSVDGGPEQRFEFDVD